MDDTLTQSRYVALLDLYHAGEFVAAWPAAPPWSMPCPATPARCS